MRKKRKEDFNWRFTERRKGLRHWLSRTDTLGNCRNVSSIQYALEIETICLKWDLSARLSSFFSIHDQLWGSTNQLARLDLISSNFAKWIKPKITRTKKLEGCFQWIDYKTDHKIHIEQVAREHRYFTKHVLYPPVVYKCKDKNQEFYTACISPIKNNMVKPLLTN